MPGSRPYIKYDLRLRRNVLQSTPCAWIASSTSRVAIRVVASNNLYMQHCYLILWRLLIVWRCKNVDEAKGVCKVHSSWHSVVSAYPHRKRCVNGCSQISLFLDSICFLSSSYCDRLSVTHEFVAMALFRGPPVKSLSNKDDFWVFLGKWEVITFYLSRHLRCCYIYRRKK